MTRYKIFSSAYDRKTNKLILAKTYKHRKKKRIREEIINTDTNELFKSCKTKQDVKRKYEAFWNDLNPNSEEIVKVRGVVKL